MAKTTLEKTHKWKIHLVDQYSSTVIAESRLVYRGNVMNLVSNISEIELREKNYWGGENNLHMSGEEQVW